MKRSGELDVLRGIAILLVLVTHTWPIYRQMADSPIWRFFQIGGWSGVDLFFVLSGFLIGGLLFAEYRETGQVHIGRFLIRRGFKIYPSFWFVLAICLIFPIYDPRPTFANFLAEFFYFQNYSPGFLGVSWSLAIEEHFYLLLALLVFLLVRQKSSNPFRSIPRIAISLGIICLLLRLITAITINEYSQIIHFYPTHLRIDSLAFGVMLAYFNYYHSERFRLFSIRFRYLLLVAGVLLFFPAFLLGQAFPLITTVGVTGLYIGSGLILVAITTIKLPGPFRILSLIGRYSYSIYLWHIPIENIAGPFLRQLPDENLSFFLYILMSSVGGILIGRLIEIPILKFRDKKFPSIHADPTSVKAGAPVTNL